MKKLIMTACILALVAPFGCKKKEVGTDDKTIARKYALYQVSVYKDKDFKEWLATLEKAESVDLLSEEKYINQKSMQIDLSQVRLADGKEGYMESKHLADKPIVFIEESTRLFVRPNMGSKVFCTVPKGTIGFIKEEKADWVLVYIGNMAGKWITGQWAQGGYSTDENLVVEAKDYEAALSLLKERQPDKKAAAEKNAREKLAELAKGSSVIAGMAKSKLDELDEKPPADAAEGVDQGPETGEKSAE